MAELRLHNFFASSSSWRVRIALELKGLEYEYVPVHLRRKQNLADDFEGTNPMRQVPTLEIPGPRYIAQSMAILEWLDESFPVPPLLPSDAYLRAKTRELAELVNSGIQPFQNISVQRQVKSLGLDPNAWPVFFVEKGLRALERAVQETAGVFSVGDSPTLADLYLVPQLDSARRFGIDLGARPTLLRIEEACTGLAAFAAARPERQPDFEA
jgi:maleylacetoacetate isomerase